MAAEAQAGGEEGIPVVAGAVTPGASGRGDVDTDLPLYVRRNAKQKYYVTFARKGANGDLVQFISPVSAQLSLARAWAERLQGHLQDSARPVEDVRDEMIDFTRRSQDAEGTPRSSARDLPECGKRYKNGSLFLRYNYRDEQGKKRQWDSPCTQSIELLRDWAAELKELKILKQKKVIDAEELVRRLKEHVLASKEAHEPSALPPHVRRQGLKYYIRYDALDPDDTSASAFLGTTGSVWDPCLARELSQYFDEHVKPRGRQACGAWLRQEEQGRPDCEGLVPWSAIVAKDQNGYIHTNGQPIRQVFLLNGCVPDGAGDGSLMSDKEYVKIAARIRAAGYPVVRTRAKKCSCRESPGSSSDAGGARTGLCASFTSEEKDLGARVLEWSMKGDLEALRQADALVGAADELPHPAASTLYLFCGAHPALCVTSGLLADLQKSNYSCLPQAARLMCTEEAARLARVYDLLRIENDEATAHGARASALESRRDAGVMGKIGSAASASRERLQTDAEYIAERRASATSANYEYKCALCEVWVSNGNWGRGHCSSVRHRARRVGARVGGVEHMNIPPQKRKSEDTIDCLTCGAKRIRLTEDAWRAHLETHAARPP